MHRIIIAIALLALPLAADAQVKRCADGSYSDRCGGGGGTVIDRGNVSSYTAPRQPPTLQFNQGGSQGSRRYRQAGQAARNGQDVQTPRSIRQRAQSAGLSRNELVRARNRGTLLRGMSRQDVEHILGRPDDVNTYVGSGGRCDDLWYRDSRRGWHTRVTMCNGQLESYGADTR
ncbi:hypothetical protein [Halomonas getboli]|uniref:hypothetical protein n=1 Tax=Halomonas getboli TaxID=2935862 RepID=UPI001FFFCC80|nr:hypothetical protein [Halomonas getboli]MCK2183499.1 hypothetical protein [Halomonas getboli]